MEWAGCIKMMKIRREIKRPSAGENSLFDRLLEIGSDEVRARYLIRHYVMIEETYSLEDLAIAIAFYSAERREHSSPISYTLDQIDAKGPWVFPRK